MGEKSETFQNRTNRPCSIPPFPLTPNPKNCIYILFTLHHDPFTRREKTRAMRARIPSPQGGEEEETGEKQEKDDRHSCTKGGRRRNRPPIRISLSSTAVVAVVEEDRSTRRRTTSRTIVGRESGKGAHRANCNSVETIGPSGSQGEECDCWRGEEGLEEVPGHLFIVYAPGLLLAMITSLGQTSTARDIFLSHSLYPFISTFFPTFFFFSLSLYSSLFCRAKSISRSRFIRSVPYSPDFSALEEGGGDRFVVTRCPENSIFETADTPSSSDFLLFLLIIF